MCKRNTIFQHSYNRDPVNCTLFYLIKAQNDVPRQIIQLNILLESAPPKLLLLYYEIGYGERKVQIKYIKYFVPVLLLGPWSVSPRLIVVKIFLSK